MACSLRNIINFGLLLAVIDLVSGRREADGDGRGNGSYETGNGSYKAGDGCYSG